jgi:hypothetical protein
VVTPSQSNGFKNGKVIHLHYVLIIPWSKVFLEKLAVFQPVKNFSRFYRSRKFITALTSARHLFVSWASSIQSIPIHPTSWISVLILPSHLRLGLLSGLFPSGFPTNNRYTPLLSPIRATNPAHLIILDFISYNYIGLYNFMEIACVRLLKLNLIN